MKVHNVEQGTEDWHALRAGKPTASEFSKLVTSKGDASKSLPEYAMQLAGDYIAGEPLDRWQGNQWSNRGHKMEDRALAYYELEYPGRLVTQVGFVTNDDETVGASPDSLVHAGPHVDPTGTLEIKCLQAPRHIKAILYFQKNNKMPTEYVQQTQGQMLIAECKWNDLLFWHPDLPALIIHSQINEVFVSKLKTQIQICLGERNRVVAMLKALN